jgi:hypothetical protein
MIRESSSVTSLKYSQGRKAELISMQLQISSEDDTRMSHHHSYNSGRGQGCPITSSDHWDSILWKDRRLNKNVDDI